MTKARRKVRADAAFGFLPTSLPSILIELSHCAASMQSGGGFIIDDLSTVFASESGRPVLQESLEDPIPESVATPKPLTSKQEAKLRSFLDGALEDITRGYRKRFDPSSTLHTLPSYLGEWMRLLGVLAHVPPYGGGSTNLLISYLLRCSTELCDGITGYSFGMEFEVERRERKRQKKDPAGEDEDRDSDDEEDRQNLIASRTKQLNLALQTLDLLDRIWAAVLRGNLINLPVALINSRAAFPDTTDANTQDEAQSHKPYNPRTLHSTSSLVPSPAIDGRFVPASTSSNSARESLPIHGGRGNRTVGVTDQVRLRNIAISSREKLFSWMRTELDAPPPPRVDDNDGEQEPPDSTLDGVLEVKVEPDTVADGEEEEEGDDPDMEDVDIGATQSDVGEEDTEEHKHYQDLFDRKLDPDADDDDDEDRPTGSDQALGASVLGTLEAVSSHEETREKRKRDDSEEQDEADTPRADGLPSKRPRADADAEGEADNKMSRSELGSLNFNLDAIGQWDLSFTRLFSRTLRTLSDLSEVTKRGTSGKTDFTSSLAGISGADERETDDRD